MPGPPPDLKLIPQSFIDDVCQAAAHAQQGILGLLNWEAEPYPWSSAAHRLVDAQITAQQPGNPSRPAYARAIVFTGHMIDAPDRPTPRFPPQAEPAARDAISHSLRNLRTEHPGSIIGLAGGASGGDLLFHEACEALGIPTLLRLTLPEPLFLEASVAPAGPDWVRRFHALTARLGPERIETLSQTADLPVWLTATDGYDIWQRTNLWLIHEAIAHAPARTLLALWDGQPGDGPGGTEHLVEAAPRFGFTVAPILHTSSLIDSIHVKEEYRGVV